MKKVKLAIAATAVLTALMGIGTGVSAQQGPMGDGGPCMGPGGPGMEHGRGMMNCRKGFGRHMGPGARLDMMTAHLGLTPEQRYKILPILDQQFKEMKAVRSDDNLTRAQVRAKMLDIRKNCYEQIRTILTPEQQKKHDEMRAKMKEHWKSRHEGKLPQPSQPEK